MPNSSLLTPSQTQTLRDLVANRTGLDLNRRTLLEPRDLLAGEDADAALRKLAGHETDHPAWQHLIDALTIGETYFFRNPTQFELLRNHILSRVTHGSTPRPLTVWSVGCASGEEPYSVYMALRGVLPKGWTLRVIGTDLSATAIETGKRGIYREWSFRGNYDDLLHANMAHVEDGYQLSESIRNAVTLRQGNLLESDSPTGWADIVLCRNVLLYLTAEARVRAENALLHAIGDGGWLLLGHAEALVAERSPWKAHIVAGSVAYERAESAEKSWIPIPTRKAPKASVTSTVTDTAAYHQALLAYHQKDHSTAEAHLTALISDQNNHPNALVLFGASLADRGEATEAERVIRIALAQVPLYADAHYLLATLALERGDRNAAIDSLRAALYSEPTHTLAMFMLGVLVAEDGKPERAQNLWQQAQSAIENLSDDERPGDIAPYTTGTLREMLARRLTTASG
ncbi:MAG: CheR family methyltransferase [Chloroflexota bacterium]